MKLGARFYDPEVGRFISQDSYLGEPGTPPSLHRYLYAYGNPTVYIDPNGNFVAGTHRYHSNDLAPNSWDREMVKDREEAEYIANEGEVLKQRKSEFEKFLGDPNYFKNLSKRKKIEAKFTWENASGKEKIQLASTGVGISSAAVPYAGDYVSAASSFVNLVANPSVDAFGEFLGDSLGAALPFLGPIGSLKRMERMQDAQDLDRMLELKNIGNKTDEVTVYRMQPKKESNIVTGGAFLREREKGSSLVEANNKRLKYMTKIESPEQSVKLNALQNAQASGKQSPLISTTFNKKAAMDAANELRSMGVDVEVLTIKGPLNGGIDFESIFRKLGGRPKPNRFKDAALEEFGIKDLFIPAKGESKSGFEIIKRE